MATRPYWFAFGSGNPATNTGLAPTFIFFINTSGATIAPPTITEGLTLSGLYLVNYSPTQTISFILDGATTGLVTSDRYIAGVMDPNDLFGGTLTAIGNSLFALGTTLTAIGNSTLVYGSSLTAQGVTLTAIGFSNLVYGISLFALGTSNIALGTSNIALGTTSVAQNVTLTAIGYSMLVYGVSLTAQGVAQGVSMSAMGNTLVGIGISSLAAGQSSALFSFIGSTASSFGTTGIDPGTVFGFLMRAQEIAEGNQVYTKATGAYDMYNRGSSTLLREKTISDTATSTTKT